MIMNTNALVIIDAGVESPRTLCDDLANGPNVRLLHAHEDAIAVIGQELEKLNTVTSLHIVAHGAPGFIRLAGDEITTSVLRERSASVSAWSKQLPDAEILIYGCETGAGQVGRQFLSTLSDLTGARSAAAETEVGDGRWRLGVQPEGRVKTPPVFSEALQNSYAGTFADVTFSIDPPFSIESTTSSTIFRFTLDEAPAPGQFVSVWFYASSVPGTPPSAAIGNEISQFDIFSILNPANIEGIPIGGLTEANGVPGYDPDVSVLAGASSVPDFTVFELRLTQLENSIRFTGFDDGVNDGPRTVFWNVIDNPTDSQANTITNGTIQFTEVDNPSELPPQNTAPVANNDTASTSFETSVEIDVLANDDDSDGDTLAITSFSAPTQGGSVVIDDRGTADTLDDLLVYTPNSGFSGEDTFTYLIGDGNGGEDTATVTVNVEAQQNEEPIAENDAATTRPGAPVEIDVLANDSDGDGDSVAIVSAGGASNGTVSVNDQGTTDTSDDTVTYTPDPGFEGTDSFSYEISDGNGGSDTATVDVSVGDPVVSISADKTTLVESEGDAVTLTFNVENLPAEGLRISVGTYRPGDGDQDTLAFGIADFNFFPFPPPGATFTGLVPTGGWVGNDGFTFLITDPTASVTLPLNSDDPDRAPGEAGFTRNNDVGVEQVEWRIVDFSRLNPGLPGPDDYEIADGSGSVVLTLKDTPDQTYEAADDRAITNPDQAVEIDVLANDSGGVEIVGIEDRDVSSQGLLANGTLTIDDKGTDDTSDDTIIYTPDEGFSGTDRFAYLVRNADGEVDQARVTVEVNGAPDAVLDLVEIDQDAPAFIDVLANDSDPEDEPLEIVGVTQGENGTVAIDDNGTAGDTSDDRILYTPSEGFTGSDSFSYTISDPNGNTDTATVNVGVGMAFTNDPVAVDDFYLAQGRDRLQVGAESGLLANDSDPDGDALTVLEIVDRPANGLVLSLNPDGSFSYRADPGFTGEDTFTYRVVDGQGGESIGTATILVNGTPTTVADSYRAEQDTALVVNAEEGLLANDSDPEGDPLTADIDRAPLFGSVEIAEDGSFVYTPNAGVTGVVDSFAYTARDDNGGESQGIVSVQIGELPVVRLSADRTEIVENDPESNSVTLTINVADLPPGGLLLSLEPVDADTGQPFDYFTDYDITRDQNNELTDLETSGVDFAQGEVVAFGGNVVFANLSVRIVEDVATITLPALADDDVGPENHTWRISLSPNAYEIVDGEGEVTVTVLDQIPNVAPDAADDTVSTAPDTAVDIDVLANDSDADGDALAITEVSTAQNGTVVVDDKGTADTSDDTIVYTPDDGFEGGDSFTYTVSDGNGGTDTATVDVTVEIPPTPIISISADKTTVVESEGDNVTFTFNVENLPADGVRVSVATFRPGSDEVLPGGVADFDAFRGQVSGITNFGGFNGNGGFTFLITEDGATFTVPIFDDQDTPPGTPGQTRNDDVGVEQTEWRLVDFSLANPPFNEVGNFEIAEGQGSVVLTLKDTPDQTYEAGDDVASTSERRAIEIDVLANDNGGVEIVSLEDPDTSFFGQLQNGTVEINDQGTADTSDDTVIYRPDSGFVGTESFTYLVRNAEGELDQAQVTVDVGPLQNTLPDATDDELTTAFNTPISISVAELLSNDNDADGDRFEIQADRLGTPVPSGSLEYFAGDEDDPTDDTIVFTPDDGFVGEVTFDYIIRDAFGGEDTATVTVTVEAQENQNPVAVDDRLDGIAGIPLEIDVLANDSDPDGDPLEILDFSQTRDGTLFLDDRGTADTTDDVLIYTPDEDFVGNDFFQYLLGDGNGGTAVGTVIIDVEQQQQNENPVAENDTVNTAIGAPVNIDVLANDTDADGDALSVGEFTEPENGSLVLEEDGTLTYTPDEGFLGEDSFTYFISDGNGGSDSATVTIVVDEEANRDPVAVDDTAATTVGSSVNINVTANDTDLDEDNLFIAEVTSPANGNVDAQDDDIITYTPRDGFVGEDSFSYTISDGNGGTSTATVTVTVTEPENRDPVAESDTVSTAAGTAVNFDVLANDTDADGDALFVSELANPENGVVELESDGTITYTPRDGFVGEDSFTYFISDGNGGSDSATVTVTVTEPENRSPVAADDDFRGFAVPVDSVLPTPFLALLDNDGDPDGDPLTITGVENFVNANVVIDDGGTPDDATDDQLIISFNTDDGGTEASFTYTVSDGNGGTDQAQVFFDLDVPVNADPDAEDDSALAFAGRSTVINVLANDTDADGDSLTISTLGNPSNGTVTDNGDGTVTYTPNEGYTGPDSFTYEVADGNGGSDTATVNITVEEEVVPDPVKVTFSVAENQVFLDEQTQQTWTFAVEGEIPSTGVAVWFYADQPGASFVTRDALFPDAVDGDIVPQVINQYNLFAFNQPGAIEGIDFSIGNSDVSALTGLLQFPDFSVFQVLITEETGTISLPAFNDELSIFVEGQQFDLSAPYSVVWKIADAPIITDENSPASQGGRPDNLVVDVEFEGSPQVTVFQSRDQLPSEGNTDPTAAGEEYTVAPGETLTVAVDAGVLSNDTDADEDPITAFILENPRNGSLTLNDDGSFKYTPSDGFEGEDSFTYLVRDDAFGSSVATATITVGEDGGDRNPVTGTDDSEFVTGTDGDDDIDGKGGSYDRLIGGLGNDNFIFGGETQNGQRERDGILDYEIGEDAIILQGGTKIASHRDVGTSVYIALEGDGDTILVRGAEPLSFEDLTIIEFDEFVFV